jgi:hypothetical protein
LLTTLLKSTIAKNKSLILRESQGLHNFMERLMKKSNTGKDWTAEDIKEIKSHLRHLAFYVPVLVIFLLPFGLFLLRVLAEIMDRREEIRGKAAAGSPNSTSSL